MVKGYSSIIAVLIISLFSGVVLAGGEEIPWSKLQDAKDIKPGHREVAEKVMRSESPYAGCSDSIAQCLTDEPDNPAVLRIANFVLRRAKQGKAEKSIVMDIRRRAASAYPAKVHKIDHSGLIPSGDPKAKVVAIVYADFECPYCNIAAPALRKLSLERPKLISYYFKNFPVKSHKRGVASCMALMAADRQGAFWKMHDLLYAADDLSEESMITIAGKAGLDVARFKKDMKDRSVLPRIRKEKEEGLKLGIEGTPGIFINGKFYMGVKTYRELLDRIEEEVDIIDGRQ